MYFEKFEFGCIHADSAGVAIRMSRDLQIKKHLTRIPIVVSIFNIYLRIEIADI